MQYLGIDWGTRRAAWCSLSTAGELIECSVSADEDGLARLVARLGPDVRGCIEMMSGAVWVRDRLSECGWTIEIADARKVKAIAPLACNATARPALPPHLADRRGPREPWPHPSSVAIV